MKKLFAVMLVVIMVLTTTACGTTNDTGKYVIGICQIAKHEALDAATQGFKDAVVDALGEENVTFKSLDASNDYNVCSNIILDFVNSNVDLILANATPVLQAAFSATDDIPILGTSITEYGVALGIENFSGTVGGNISGTSDLAPLDQQAAMIKEWFPDAKNIGLLYCSAEPNSLYQVQTVQKELEALGFTCKTYAFSSTSDLASFTQTAADESDVIYVPTDNTAAEATGTIDSICRPAGVPVFTGEKSICSGCGVATLSIDYYDLGVATGKMAVKILTGEADISTMKIEYAPEFEKLYNAEICKELNLKVPDGYAPIQ